MNCIQIKEYLYQYIDKELEEETVRLIAEHLKNCPLCSEEVDREKRFDCLIRTHFPKEKAPYRLKEAVLSKIKSERESHWFSSLGIKAGSIVISAVLLILILIRINRPFPIFDVAVKTHIGVLQQKLNMQLFSSDPDKLLNWLQSQLDFKVIVPNLSKEGIRLLGARIDKIANKRAALIIYQKDSHKISLYMFEAENIKLPKARKVILDKEVFYLAREKGYSSILWIEKGIVCVFVSDLSEAKLLHLVTLL